MLDICLPLFYIFLSYSLVLLGSLKNLVITYTTGIFSSLLNKQPFITLIPNTSDVNSVC